MLLRPKNLRQLKQQLEELPESKRRTIVLVGRHLNEATQRIARDHHKTWEENGAVAVKIPVAWTELGAQLARKQKDYKRRLDDNPLLDWLHKKFPVPIVNLHCTYGCRETGYARADSGRIPELYSYRHNYLGNIMEKIEIRPNELLVEYMRGGVRRRETPAGKHLKSYSKYAMRTTKNDIDWFNEHCATELNHTIAELAQKGLLKRARQRDNA
ncbi:MAG: hypothetical protein AABW54_02090 [Candidatus Micrarchaeota archaeon]